MRTICKMVFIIIYFYVFNNLPGYCQFNDTQSKLEVIQKNTFSQPRHFFAYFNLSDSTRSKSRLDVYWEFVNDILQFVKIDESQYRARYEIEANLLDEKGSLVDSHTIIDEIVTNDFSVTNSTVILNHGVFSLFAPPGNYKFRLELIDLDTQRHLLREKDFELKDFSHLNNQLSDILFFDARQTDAGQITYFPNLAGNFKDSLATSLAYYEIYPHQELELLKVHTQIIDFNENVVYDSIQTVANNQQGIIQKEINLKAIVWQPGRYLIKICFIDNPEEVAVDRHFFLNLNHLPFSLDNLENAYEPIKIIGDPKELHDFEKASPAMKKALFDAFWKQRDPTPGTEKNEVKDEFYKRVEFCYRQFTVYSLNKMGWETERGKIYLKFGEPSLVQKYASHLHKPPTEIWYYRSINERFLFVDRSGVGDYKMIRRE